MRSAHGHGAPRLGASRDPNPCQGHFMKARNERCDSLRDPKPTPDLSSRAEGEGSRPTHVALARLPRRSPRVFGDDGSGIRFVKWPGSIPAALGDDP